MDISLGKHQIFMVKDSRYPVNPEFSKQAVQECVLWRHHSFDSFSVLVSKVVSCTITGHYDYESDVIKPRKIVQQK